MNVDVAQWIAHLPRADEQVGDGLVLTGYVLPAGAGEMRLAVGEVGLAFALADILDVAPAQEDFGPASSTPAVRVVVRRGASLLDARPAMLVTGRPRMPFALSVRLTPVVLEPSRRFRDLERRFLLDHSLLDA
jgi:hypothetical protein